MVLLHTTTYKSHASSADYRLKWLFILMYGIRPSEPPRETLMHHPSVTPSRHLNDAPGAYEAALVVLRTDWTPRKGDSSRRGSRIGHPLGVKTSAKGRL